MAGKLAGKVVILAGATSGMGRETALLFAREGAKLTLAGRRAGLLQELGEQIAAETGAVTLGIPCDTRNRDEVQSLINATKAHFGRIDVLVYATGTNTPDRAVDRLTPPIWDELIATNLTGAYHCTQLILPVFREQGGGLIIYVSSISALRGDVSGVAYQASKCGLDGLSRGIMIEEKDHGIRTSVIYPGLTDTPLMLKRPVMPSADQLAVALQPEDIAEACLYLAAQHDRVHIPELVIQPSRFDNR